MAIGGFMKELANIFKALSDETRVHMLALLLMNEELCVCDFMNLLEISQSRASRHLRYMFHAGLLNDRREGVWVHYRISKDLSKNSKILLESLEKVFTDPAYKEVKSRCKQYLQEKAAAKSARYGCE